MLNLFYESIQVVYIIDICSLFHILSDFTWTCMTENVTFFSLTRSLKKYYLLKVYERMCDFLLSNKSRIGVAVKLIRLQRLSFVYLKLGHSVSRLSGVFPASLYSVVIQYCNGRK